MKAREGMVALQPHEAHCVVRLLDEVYNKLAHMPQLTPAEAAELRKLCEAMQHAGVGGHDGDRTPPYYGESGPCRHAA